MKFDFCIGNPPYQENSSGTSKYAPSVFNDFMDATYAISDKVELITPAKFLFNAGTTPKSWNKKMLQDEHFKVLDYHSDSSEVFPKPVEIKGGVAIHYRDNMKSFGKIDNFSVYPEVYNILNKMQNVLSQSNLGQIINVCSKFNMDALEKDFPQYKGHERRMSSNVLVFDCFSPDKANDTIGVYGVIENQRICKYIPTKYVDMTMPNICKYKVCLPKAEGNGQFGETVTNPFISEPNTGYTHTFYGIGAFDTEAEAINTIKYVKTKFTRTLLSVLKITQNVNANTWIKVPLQDFTDNSDIDWSQSIPDIDMQLYAKYGLSQEEIDFIETHVKPME